MHDNLIVTRNCDKIPTPYPQFDCNVSITVRLFASLRERLGTGREELDASAVATVADAWAAITAEPLSDNVLAAINHEYVGADTAVHDGDEVAFFPPVTGG